jgi:hypothetical protein
LHGLCTAKGRHWLAGDAPKSPTSAPWERSPLSTAPPLWRRPRHHTTTSRELRPPPPRAPSQLTRQATVTRDSIRPVHRDRELLRAPLLAADLHCVVARCGCFGGFMVCAWSAVSRCSRTGAFGQPVIPSTIRCIRPVPVDRLLPERLPVPAAERARNQGARASRATSLDHGSISPRRGAAAAAPSPAGPAPVAQKMDTADADANFRMAAQVDQRFVGHVTSAAPGSGVPCAAHRRLAASAHSRFPLPTASVGARDPAAPTVTMSG